MEPRLFMSAAGAGLPVRLEPEGETLNQKTAAAIGDTEIGGQPARTVSQITRRRAHLSHSHGNCG